MRADGRSAIDKVAATGAVLALVAAFVLPFATLRPNRLAAGDPHWLWEAGAFAIPVLGLAILALAGALVKRDATRGVVLLGSAAGYVWAISFAQGALTSQLLAEQLPAARVSVGAGMWVALVAAAVIGIAGREAWGGSAWIPVGSIAAALAGIAAAFAWGGLDQTSLAREFGVRAEIFWGQVVEHLALTAAGLALGLLIGVPLGIWASHSRRIRDISLYSTSILQTIPSLAVLGLLIAPLAALAAAYPALSALGIRGIGWTPAIIALTLYALLPIVRNTYTGLVEVDPGIVDAGRGMGMSSRQLLGRVELPLAMPLVLEGVRLAVVLLLGITALTALNGAGGLGFFIFEGLNQAAPDLILLGAVPLIALALVLDIALRRLSAAVTPKGVRPS